jgi:PAS domain S-box-containing protein
MRASGFQRSCLPDDRLAPVATSALPAWLWSVAATRILWANPVGAAIFGSPTSATIGARKFDTGEPAAAQIARLATTLVPGAPPRFERLRGFGAGVGSALICACSHIVLGDGTPAILVVAAERAGPDLPLDERVRRLLADCHEPIAAFSTDGWLVAGTESGQLHLRGTTSLAALDAQELAASALASGHAAGRINGGEVAIDRIGGEATAVLIVSFDAPNETSATSEARAGEAPRPATPECEAPAREPGGSALGAPVAPRSQERPSSTLDSSPQPEPVAAAEVLPASSPPAAATTDMPTERRYPLRFVWQMDEAGCFTLSSDEFIALIGPRTAAAIGRTWPEMAAELGLDPEGWVARAIATRNTWSGLTVVWPLDDSTERLAVELSGLPVFDRDRVFRGYRGFGVCRDLARLIALAQRQRLRPAAAEKTTQVGSQDPVPPEAATAETTTSPAGSENTVPENILPFRSAAVESIAPALSAIERSAFRELSRKLSQRLTAAGIEHASTHAVATDEEEVADPGVPISASAPDTLPMLDKLPVGILIYRLDQLLYANPVFLRWSGHASLDSLIAAGGLGELFVEPVGDTMAAGAKPLTLAVDRGDKISIEGELINIHWEGEPAHALVTAAPAQELSQNERAQVERAQIEREQIERTQIEREKLELAQAEIAELRSILDTATDGVVMVDRQGRIISANRSAQALFDYGAEEFSGRAFTDLFAQDSAAAAQEYLDGLVRDGIASLINGGCEVIGRARQGDPIPLFMTIGRIGDGAEKLCAVFRDITPWKKSEEDLVEAKRQAENASSAKSDFLAKISHEIRTPLNAIIGFSEVMMEERFGPIANERYRGYVEDIHASGGHLLSLINDLLDLSKIEAGKLELAFTGVSLNDLTQQCVAIMQPQANRERIIIRTSLPPALPQVVADARSVRQIVLNLLSNSIKFTGAGGQVIVSTALNDNGEVVLRVRDTGVGMAEKELVTALEPFRQIATSARGGTGLGLPLTKALAEANRASFHIRSAPREGTLVEIAFPPSRVLAG